MDQDCDGRIILSYELMMEAEHPMPERIAWNKPDSRTLECLVWAVYDGLLSPGPTPKLTGPSLITK